MPMHPAQVAIDAAERCIAVLQRGGAVSTTDLVILCDAAGEPCEMLCRRLRIGWLPLDATDAVIERLGDYIDDMRLELPR